jgi:hypothetical protein
MGQVHRIFSQDNDKCAFHVVVRPGKGRPTRDCLLNCGDDGMALSLYAVHMF